MADQAKSETQNDDPLAESTDIILAAAQKLMQLNNNNNDDDVRGKRKRISGEEVDQRPNDNTTSAKINEIFGNDIEVIARPKKRKKYRSLASIYRVTTPINTEKGKKGESLNFNK